MNSIDQPRNSMGLPVDYAQRKQPDELLSDRDITNILAEAGVDDSILEAAVYAVRNNDFYYLKRQYELLARPVVSAAEGSL